MVTTSLFSHLFSLAFFLWAGFQIFSYQEQKRVLLKLLLKEDQEPLFLVKNPVSFLRVLGKIFDLPQIGGWFFFDLTRKKVRVDRLIFLLLRQKIQGIHYKVCSKGENNVRISFDVNSDLKEQAAWEEILSKDLCAMVSLNRVEP